MDRLMRHGLDEDLIAQIEAGGIVRKPQVTKTKLTPRASPTYRGFRRNQRRVRRAIQLSIKRGELAA